MRLSNDEWNELFSFYNRAAAQCYAAETAEPEPSLEFPKAKTMHRDEGQFGYSDMWYTGKNGKLGVSGGHSILTFDQVPVWMLQYWGWYDMRDDRVLEMLKQALLVGYTTGQSQGGRGPDLISSKDGMYSYLNTIEYRAKGALVLPEHFQTEPWNKRGLLNFSGYEWICRKEKPTSSIPAFEVFRHDFAGFALIN